MTGRKTLWLVGMLGAGKSAVGRELAARLGLGFADTDALSVESVAEVVAQRLRER